jgi:NAD(P)-dependent dehydrogenase (short-subunit alcohol dehydrogenase family)
MIDGWEADMGALDGRVAIITGAGRGLGREHALYFASEGARVVVNDTGSGPDGLGDDHGPAQAVAEEIRAAGGEAIANTDDVTDWKSGERLIFSAVEAFGDLHVLVINTSSTSGLFGNPGQSNYGAAKAGIGALTLIAAQELGRYGVRVNAIAPAARTRLTEATPGLDVMVRAPEDNDRFDEWDPANVSPVVAWLASRGCEVTGRTFSVFGGEVQPMTGWTREPGVARSERWTVEDVARELPPLLS